MLSARDRRIVELTRLKAGDNHSFERAVAALHLAVEEVIPAGHVYWLGTSGDAPIIGSRISGIGLTVTADGVTVAKVDRGTVTLMERLFS